MTTDAAVPAVDDSEPLASGPAGRASIWSRPFPAGSGWLVVVAVVSLLAGAGLGFALASTGQQTAADVEAETYLAYAVSGQKGTLGSGSGDSPAHAQAAAEAGCRDNGGGPSCQGVLWWNNGAVSIEVRIGGPGEQTWSTFSDDDPNSNEPESSARDDCGSCDEMLNLSVAGRLPFNSGGMRPLHSTHTATIRHGPGPNQVAMVFVSDTSQPVYPVRSGRVVFAGPSVSGHPLDGDTVIVDHHDGVYSAYGKLDSVNLVAAGTEVTPQMHLGRTRGGDCSASDQGCWQTAVSVVDLGSQVPVSGSAALTMITRGPPLPLPWSG